MAHRIAPQAEIDLTDIWYYVAKESGSVEIANRLIDSFTRRFLLLAGHPYLGRARDGDFGAGVRGFPVEDYVVNYGQPQLGALGRCLIERKNVGAPTLS